MIDRVKTVDAGFPTGNDLFAETEGRAVDTANQIIELKQKLKEAEEKNVELQEQIETIMSMSWIRGLHKDIKGAILNYEQTHGPVPGLEEHHQRGSFMKRIYGASRGYIKTRLRLITGIDTIRPKRVRK